MDITTHLIPNFREAGLVSTLTPEQTRMQFGGAHGHVSFQVFQPTSLLEQGCTIVDFSESLAPAGVSTLTPA